MMRMDQTNSSTEASQALSIGPEMHNSVLSHEHIWWGFPFGIVAILFGAFLYFCIKDQTLPQFQATLRTRRFSPCKRTSVFRCCFSEAFGFSPVQLLGLDETGQI